MARIINYALRLLIVCVIASGVLAFVYQSTAQRIEENKRSDKLLKAKSLLPVGTVNVEEGNLNGTVFFKGYADNGSLTAVAIEASAKGYGGAVRVLVVVDNNARVINLAILGHSETPGLGSKIEAPSFLDQYKDRSENQLSLKKDSGQADGIDAVAAATISSRAVVKAVKEALSKYKEVSNAQ